MNEVRRTQIFVTTVALLVVIVHALLPNITIDSISLVLLVIAVLPWLIPLLKSLEFPGGWKLEFQELQQAKNEANKAGLLSTKSATEKTKRNPKKSLPLYSFELVLDQDPNLALAGLRIELEKRLVQIATSRGLNVEKMGVGSLLRSLKPKTSTIAGRK